ncbi:putative aromatic-L-amino-acid decarboxylase [Dioszegia hungarica]|uniref:Aromatic-L-amino-acid decarboxylase n=1 Tax=Dioszegia hungarica TaxID=4972 RepID=A0AA38H811_9TREE|nr:putative aromatic-L-amino-acid decarboxylase [Dioszegia hungarica]KAI9635328.1 putative aromatic-L-amino-acid decarboxylase [Dioszegia hungarica]
MDIEGFRKAGYAAVDAICDYYTNLSKRTVKAEVQPGYLIEQLPREAPSTGEDFATVAADFQSLILPGITHWQHGKFMAYFPAISTFESMIADLYATSVSNPGFNWVCSPACTELEQVTMDWMAKILGLGKEFHLEQGSGGGVILNSASEAALTAAIAARETALRELTSSEPGSTVSGGTFDVPDDLRAKYSPKLVMYGSTQTHSLGEKAALILGLSFRAVPVAAADGYALRGDALRKAIEEDVKKGLIPFYVIATVGTTSTGAVDRIDEIGQVVSEYKTISLHIDSAWAGVALALEDQRAFLRLDDINRYATSFCTNMHKWGLVAFDCSLFFVRNRKALNLALDATPAFLRSKEADTGTVIDYRNWQLALGRRFRSIKIWFVMRSYGVKGFQDHLRVGIDQCQQLSKLITASSSFEIVTPPSLSLIVFRLGGAALPADTLPAERNLLNTLLNNRLNARYDVFLTQTMLHSADQEDVFCIRIALGGRTTTMQDVEEVWAVVEEEGEAVLKEWRDQKA